MRKYEEPDEITESQLLWNKPGRRKRIVASKAFYEHNSPHNGSVESAIDYCILPEKFSDLAKFDGSVIVECTAGEVSARRHDDQANFPTLNLMHDIVGSKPAAPNISLEIADDFAGIYLA